MCCVYVVCTNVWPHSYAYMHIRRLPLLFSQINVVSLRKLNILGKSVMREYIYIYSSFLLYIFLNHLFNQQQQQQKNFGPCNICLIGLMLCNHHIWLTSIPMKSIGIHNRINNIRTGSNNLNITICFAYVCVHVCDRVRTYDRIFFFSFSPLYCCCCCRCRFINLLLLSPAKKNVMIKNK